MIHIANLGQLLYRCLFLVEELRILIVYNKKDVYLQLEKGSHPAIAMRHFWGTTTDLGKTKPILVKIISNLRKIISNVI